MDRGECQCSRYLIARAKMNPSYLPDLTYPGKYLNIYWIYKTLYIYSICGFKKKYPNDFDDPLTFPPAPSSSGIGNVSKTLVYDPNPAKQHSYQL